VTSKLVAKRQEFQEFLSSRGGIYKLPALLVTGPYPQILLNPKLLHVPLKGTILLLKGNFIFQPSFLGSINIKDSFHLVPAKKFSQINGSFPQQCPGALIHTVGSHGLVDPAIKVHRFLVESTEMVMEYHGNIREKL